MFYMLSNFVRLDPRGLFNTIINQPVNKKKNLLLSTKYRVHFFAYKAQHFFNKSLLDSSKSVSNFAALLLLFLN